MVNWIGGAGPPYPQAVANTRLVGAMTARLVSQIIEISGVQASRIHVIGHSLGAHTCGYIGYYLRVQYGHNLGRITGKFTLVSSLPELPPSFLLRKFYAYFPS